MASCLAFAAISLAAATALEACSDHDLKKSIAIRSDAQRDWT
jgi:lipopolysaccharide export system protein LptA